jgi:cellulose synthase/poly-beta-1,6-N-acetylglucosamine synthase-like glycosyltransferase
MPQLYGVRRLFELPVIADMVPDDAPDEWPRVSVIITACNEEDTIENAVRSRLDDDYPGLELVLVDDRSTDRTGAIVDKLAAGDALVTAIHVEELPDGWLGKVHAMDVGARAAGGEWLVFSDADVRVRPGTIARAVSYADERDLDHLAVLPEFLPAGALIDAVVSDFSRILCVFGRVWEISDPKSSAAAGSGSFNMVRRAALEATQGLEWLRLEVADDVTMGQMLKASGARQRLAKGNGWVGVCFYPTIRDALIGSERAMFTALGGCSLARCVAIGVGLVVLELAPLALALQHRDRWSRRVGLALIGAQLAVSMIFNKWFERPLSHAAVAPLGSLAIAVLSVRAGVLGKVRGGINWRGTFYPTPLLKSGRRFRP